MNKKKVIYCPANGWDCPYFNANGCCMMYPDTDPIDECDDFAFFWEKVMIMLQTRMGRTGPMKSEIGPGKKF